MRTIRLALVCAASILYASRAADAGLLIDAGPASSLQNFSPGNYVAGTDFTITSTFTIRSLGYLDAEGDGLSVSHLVGLWDTSTQSLLTSVTVTPSSATILSAQGTGVWYMADVSALAIGPGTYRVAGTQDADSRALSGDKIGNGVSLTAGYVRTDFPSGGFNYPNLTFSSQAIRATLSTDAVAVPEPSSLVLGGLGGIGLMVVRAARRRREF